MTLVNFFGGGAVGGDGPSYHCARLRFASNGLRPTPRAMRLKSRRFIRSSCCGTCMDSWLIPLRRAMNDRVFPINVSRKAEKFPLAAGAAAYTLVYAQRKLPPSFRRSVTGAQSHEGDCSHLGG